MKDITIDEYRKFKSEFKNEIRQIVKERIGDFEAKTGVTISEVTINNIRMEMASNTYGSHKMTNYVSVEIKTDI